MSTTEKLIGASILAGLVAVLVAVGPGDGLRRPAPVDLLIYAPAPMTASPAEPRFDGHGKWSGYAP